MAAVRWIGGLAAAWATTFVIAVALYTRRVLDGYAALGLKTPFGDAAQTFFDNLMGQALSYGVVLLIGLAIAFPVAAILRRVLKPLAPLGYPLAGGAAVATALGSIEALYPGVGAFAASRTAMGFAEQVGAGVVGGFVFGLIANGRRG